MGVALTVVVLLCVALATVLAYVLYRRFPMVAIYRSKQHLQHVFDSFEDPLAVIDNAYRIRRTNRAYASMVGQRYASLIDAPCYAALRGRLSPCDDCRLQETLSARTRQVVDRSPHPSQIEGAAITLAFFPFGAADGPERTSVVEHIRDITELEKLRDRFAQKNAQLERTTAELQEAQRAIMGEIELAREVQECILPKAPPVLDGLEIDVAYQPIQSVGGDFYDFVPFSATRLGVFIADASGHGLPAAFVSTMAKMSLYNHTRTEIPPAQLLQLVNRDVLENVRTNHYLTCFWCIYDSVSRELHYSRAGHPRPIVIRADGSVAELDAPGTLLGILEDATYTQSVFQCRPGDRILLFTDGVYMTKADGATERPALDAAEFRSLVSASAGCPFRQLIPNVRERLNRFTCEDDYTIIALGIR